jgi:hypothetical protein
MIAAAIRALTPKKNAARIHPTQQIEPIAQTKQTDPCTSIYDRHRKPGAYDEYQKTLRVISPKTE